MVREIKVQVVRNREEQGLAYVQKYVDLGWTAVNQFSLGNEVYFITLVWEFEEDPRLP